MVDRRYNDEEVAAIFLAAAEGPQTPPLHLPRDKGLSLTDLQEIGREVGISPDAVAQAAQSLDLRGRAVSRTFLGLPIGVERTVALNRWLTDEEWELLVVTGHRLRLGTFKGNARASMAAGLATVGVSAAVSIASAVSGDFGRAVPGVVLLFVAGLGMFANGALPEASPPDNPP